jgi:hypothetical protein
VSRHRRKSCSRIAEVTSLSSGTAELAGFLGALRIKAHEYPAAGALRRAVARGLGLLPLFIKMLRERAIDCGDGWDQERSRRDPSRIVPA